MLYVEDDDMSRDVMNTIVRQYMGYENLYLFANSADFLPRLRALPLIPTIIFLDIHMKPLSGFELLKIIRGEADYEHVKVIALTASVMNDEVNRLKQRGFNGAVGKPISMMTFPDLVHRILAGETVWHIA